MYRVRPKINNSRQKAMEQGRDFTCAEQAGLFSLAWRRHHKHLVQRSPQRQRFSADSQCPSPSAVKACLQEGRAEVFTAWVRGWHQLLTHSLRCLKQALKNALLSSKMPFRTGFIIIWVSKMCFFVFIFSVLFRFPLCTNVQYPQNLGTKHWCSAAADVRVLRAWPSEHKWALLSLQTFHLQSQCLFSPLGFHNILEITRVSNPGLFRV